MYRVIKSFNDLHDNSFAYGVGDTFPRANVKVKDERLNELMSDTNKQGTPLIELVKEDNKSKPKE